MEASVPLPANLMYLDQLAGRAARTARRILDWRGWPQNRPLVLAGDDVRCPCCRKSFRRFSSYRGRKEARCPACGALERHRALRLILEYELANRPLPPSSRILHFAPEPSIRPFLEQLNASQYLTADITPGAGDVVADISDLCFPADTFDLIICSHVLEHVENDKRAFSELFRVTAPTGRVFLQHPIDFSRRATLQDPSLRTATQRLEAFGQEDHVRVYGRDFPDRLRAPGFVVGELTTQECISPSWLTAARIPVDGTCDVFIASRMT